LTYIFLDNDVHFLDRRPGFSWPPLLTIVPLPVPPDCTTYSIIVAAELRYGAAKHAATGDGGVARRAASLVFGTESRATSRDPIVTQPPALREDLRLGEIPHRASEASREPFDQKSQVTYYQRHARIYSHIQLKRAFWQNKPKSPIISRDARPQFTMLARTHRVGALTHKG
jgi:hypothetical protein